MHSPQCPPLTWTIDVVPCGEMNEQITIAANATQVIGEFAPGNGFAISTLGALVTMKEIGATRNVGFSAYARSGGITVYVPWAKCIVTVKELAGVQAFAWVVALEKLEP